MRMCSAGLLVNIVRVPGILRDGQAAKLREVAPGVGPVLACRSIPGPVHVRCGAAPSSACVARRHGRRGAEETHQPGGPIRRDSQVCVPCVCKFLVLSSQLHSNVALCVRLTWANRSAQDEGFDLNQAMSNFDDDIAREAKEACRSC
jgi:hypothetical protein